MPQKGAFKLRFDPYVRGKEEPEAYAVLKASGCEYEAQACGAGDAETQKEHTKSLRTSFKKMFRKLFG